MADVAERTTTKKGKRTYKRTVAKHPIVDLFPLTVDILRSMFPSNGDSPSVTTVLGALAKPALISWAAREERKMVAAYAGQLYHRLFDTVEGKVPVETFVEILNNELGKGAHLKLLAKASNVGSEVHARVEWEFKGELGLERAPDPPPLTSKQAERSFTRWTEWRAQVQLKVIAIEKRIYSSVFGFGGTLDLLAEVDFNDAAADSPFPHIVRKLAVIDFKTGKHVYAEAFLQNIAYRLAVREEGITPEIGIIVRLPKLEDDPEFDAVIVPDDPALAPVFVALITVYRWWEKQKEKRS